MPKLDEAQQILAALGMPAAQQNDMAGLTLLALCDLKANDSWMMATRKSLTITKGIMAFIISHYDRAYAPNTRETFRRQVLHQFVQGGIADYNPDNPALPTNSPKAHYAISLGALAVIQTYGTNAWSAAIQNFRDGHELLIDRYQPPREKIGIPVHLPDGTPISLSLGSHNELQAKVITEFATRFAADALVLYIGDTADKDLYLSVEKLANLNIPVTEHSKLPDILLYDLSKNWLFLIEVVTSHGPMTPKRVLELSDMLRNCPASPVFVTAFLSFAEFRKHLKNIAWETEVWIAEVPEHLIHFNGDRFLGPR